MIKQIFKNFYDQADLVPEDKSWSDMKGIKITKGDFASSLFL